MSDCVMCGKTIPAGQQSCSMCYGDIDHGSDGYYRQNVEQEHQPEPDYGDER